MQLTLISSTIAQQCVFITDYNTYTVNLPYIKIGSVFK